MMKKVTMSQRFTALVTAMMMFVSLFSGVGIFAPMTVYATDTPTLTISPEEGGTVAINDGTYTATPREEMSL